MYIEYTHGNPIDRKIERDIYIYIRMIHFDILSYVATAVRSVLHQLDNIHRLILLVQFGTEQLDE